MRLLKEDGPVKAELDSRPRPGRRRRVLVFAIVGLILGIGGGLGLGAATRTTQASATAGRTGGETGPSRTTTTAPGASSDGLSAVHGTVTGLTGQGFELRQPGGVDVTVVLTAGTHFGNKTHTDGQGDLSEGSKVTVHGTASGSRITAKRVVIESTSG